MKTNDAGQVQRPVAEQVVVITGASSGIGRETALELGRRGSSIVLAARGGDALSEVGRQIERMGGRAEVVVTDVAEWPQVERLAARAVERFGRIDTWINDAAVSAYGTVEQLTPDEFERVIAVNLLGPIYGTKAALAQMRRQGGGTIINVGSALSERAAPLQAAYSAAKHGMKGFTDALRLELQREDIPITVTLIEPSSMNTPLFDNARSKLGVKPMPIPPIYEPRVAAEAIIFAAEHPRRQIVVGGAGKFLTLGERVSPTLVDRYMLFNGNIFRQQLTDDPAEGRDNLFEPTPGLGSTTGRFGEGSKSSSAYTRIFEFHPARARVAAVGALVTAALLVRRAASSR